MARRKLGLEHLVDDWAGYSKGSPKERLHLAANRINQKLLSMQHTIQADEDGIAISSVFLTPYIMGASKVYRIGGTFGHHLNKTGIDLPLSAIPYEDGKSFWIETPDSLVFENQKGYRFLECFAVFRNGPDGSHRLFLESRHYDRQGGRLGTSQLCWVNLDGQGTINEVLDDGKNRSEIRFPRELIHFITKALVYIYSGDPDLKPEKGEVCKSSKPKKARRHLESVCPYDTVLVGYDFHGRHRHIESSIRSGHFRWQRCGVGLSQVKLIWIDETEVHYGPVDRQREPIDSSSQAGVGTSHKVQDHI
jgi:hypothetical protein